MTQPYLYIASSWRNKHYQNVLTIARGIGASNMNLPEPDFGVHDYRDAAGFFSWSDCDPDWESWTLEEYKKHLYSEQASVGFNRDMGGLEKATACLLVGPCGRSSHLELGYAVGKGLTTAIYLPEPQEPELMYRMAATVLVDPLQLTEWLMLALA